MKNSETAKENTFSCNNKCPGMSQKEQISIINSFKGNKINTLIATCIGEEGLDIGDVDLIICYDSGFSPIRMIQRRGRTGRHRDGKVVMMLMEGKEVNNYFQSVKKGQTLINTLKKCSVFENKEDKGVGKRRNELKFYSFNPRMVPDSVTPKVLLKNCLLEIEKENLENKESETNEKIVKKYKKKKANLKFNDFDKNEETNENEKKECEDLNNRTDDPITVFQFEENSKFDENQASEEKKYEETTKFEEYNKVDDSENNDDLDQMLEFDPENEELNFEKMQEVMDDLLNWNQDSNLSKLENPDETKAFEYQKADGEYETKAFEYQKTDVDFGSSNLSVLTEKNTEKVENENKKWKRENSDNKQLNQNNETSIVNREKNDLEAILEIVQENPYFSQEKENNNKTNFHTNNKESKVSSRLNITNNFKTEEKSDINEILNTSNNKEKSNSTPPDKIQKKSKKIEECDSDELDFETIEKEIDIILGSLNKENMEEKINDEKKSKQIEDLKTLNEESSNESFDSEIGKEIDNILAKTQNEKDEDEEELVDKLLIEFEKNDKKRKNFHDFEEFYKGLDLKKMKIN